MNEELLFYVFLLAPPIAGELLLLLWLFQHTRQRPAKLGWKRVLFFNALSIFALVMLAGLGGEMYYRYIYDTTDALAYTKVSKRWKKRYYVRNSAGFRDNIEYTTQRQSGKRRITFLGDSFTVGHGIKSVEDRFVNLIRAGHPEWEVHMFALLGIDTGQEIEVLKTMRSNRDGYELDQVVLVYCLNDIADLFKDWDATVSGIFSDQNRGGWLREHSYFFDTVYHRYKASHDPRIREYYSFVRDGYRGPQWPIQQARLRQLRDYVAANGGRLLVVTWPFLQLEGAHYEYQFVHDQLNQFWKQLGVPHLDLQPVFAAEPPVKTIVNRYDPHPNEYANRLAAQAIDQFLILQLGAHGSATTTAN